MQNVRQIAQLLWNDVLLLWLFIWVLTTYVAMGGWFAVTFSFLVGELGFSQQQTLLPAMVALRQWGQKYGTEVVEDPVLVDDRDRLPIGPTAILAHDGRILAHKDLRLVKPDRVGLREDGSRAEPGEPLASGDMAYYGRAQAAE